MPTPLASFPQASFYYSLESPLLGSQAVDDFLFEARDQLHDLNDNLDLVLNYINVIHAKAVFPETINFRDFLEDITCDYSQVELRMEDGDDFDTSAVNLYLDPALSRLAFNYLIAEILSKTLSDQTIDIIGDQDNDRVRIRIKGGRTLPLPGLNAFDEDSSLSPLSPEVHLAQSIITALGGEVRLEKKSAHGDPRHHLLHQLLLMNDDATAET